MINYLKDASLLFREAIYLFKWPAFLSYTFKIINNNNNGYSLLSAQDQALSTIWA